MMNDEFSFLGVLSLQSTPMSYLYAEFKFLYHQKHRKWKHWQHNLTEQQLYKTFQKTTTAPCFKENSEQVAATTPMATPQVKEKMLVEHLPK